MTTTRVSLILETRGAWARNTFLLETATAQAAERAVDDLRKALVPFGWRVETEPHSGSATTGVGVQS